MTTAELAKVITDLLKQGDDKTVSERYHADDIVSYEAPDGPMPVSKGKDAVNQKGDWFVANHEVPGATVEGPFVNGDQFAVRLKYDLTPKATGKRITMDEVGVYTIKDGKIVEERFYY